MPTTTPPTLNYQDGGYFTENDTKLGGLARERHYKNRELLQQEIIAKYQQDLDEYWWNKNAEWNSPIQQRQRYAEAGYNEHLAIGGNTPQNSLGTNAPNPPSTSGSEVTDRRFGMAMQGLQMASAAIDEYIRVQKGLGQIEEQEIRNQYLPEVFRSQISNRDAAAQLAKYREEAQRIVNEELPDMLALQYEGGYKKNQLLDYEQAEVKIQLLDRAAELLAMGFKEEDIRDILHKTFIQENGSWKSWNLRSPYYTEEYRTLGREQESRQSLAGMQKKLHDLGLHEGDAPYLRTQAVDGLSPRAAKAISAGDKVLDAALNMVSLGTKVAGVKNAYKLGKKSLKLRGKSIDVQDKGVEYRYDIGRRKKYFKYRDGDHVIEY